MVLSSVMHLYQLTKMQIIRNMVKEKCTRATDATIRAKMTSNNSVFHVHTRIPSLVSTWA